MGRLTKLLLIVRTLGVGWLWFRVGYALKKQTGWFVRQCPLQTWDDWTLERLTGISGQDPKHCARTVHDAFAFEVRSFEDRTWFDNSKAGVVAEANRILDGEFRFYSHRIEQIGFPPEWHANPISGERTPSDRHFSRISDFAFGDIKHIWEPARFHAALILGRAWNLTRDEKFASAWWRLFEDWCNHNPPNCGVHWKCGQESALRFIAIVLGFRMVSDSTESTDERCILLLRFAAATGHRIQANLGYALSQNNNHGISETAGLYLIGLLFPQLTDAEKWLRRGKTALQQQVLRLFDSGGGFSQHSLNYQRLSLQILTVCQSFAESNGDGLSQGCRQRVLSSARLLFDLCDRETGHVPVLGPNDGALLLQLNCCDYRDFKAVIQSTAVVYGCQPVFEDGPYNEDLYWLGCDSKLNDDEVKDDALALPSYLCDKADGYELIQGRRSRILVWCPQGLKFRPHHSDQLHVDLWIDGTNVFPDGGSYSYNDSLMPLFRGVESHNTVQFDKRDQMPVLGRFLYGHWLNAKLLRQPDDGLESRGLQFAAETRDFKGATHNRQIEYSPNNGDEWCFQDRVYGFQRQATVRWRLTPNWQWNLEGQVCQSDGCRIVIQADIPVQIRLVEGWVSWHYADKQPLQVLEITTSTAGLIKTTVRLDAVHSNPA